MQGGMHGLAKHLVSQQCILQACAQWFRLKGRGAAVALCSSCLAHGRCGSRSKMELNTVCSMGTFAPVASMDG